MLLVPLAIGPYWLWQLLWTFLLVWAQQSVPEWDWLPGAALVTAAGGRAEQVEARGHAWSVAGRPTAVGQVVAALQS